MNQHSFYKPYFFDQKIYKSLIDSDEIEMRFFNRTGTKIVLYWIDYNGDYFDFCLLNCNEYIKIFSNEKNYWFVRELESGIFLNFFDRHSKTVHKKLLCSGVNFNKNINKFKVQCIDIQKCNKTLYDITLLNIIKKRININLENSELPKFMMIEINEVKSFIEENIKFCKDFLDC
uniref:VHL domain-containing protein n=1 Tax=Strongyloides stercoralis TaxID=6248 RepID=A0A0K0ELT9_STRER